jgi:hypothetical protein
MKRVLILAVATALIIGFAAYAMAEDSKDKKMSKEEACALLGACGDDMANTAKVMQEECKKMMTKAEELQARGASIKAQGKMWQDKEMEADGQALIDQGKQMYDKAKAMSDACALIIDQAAKLKNKGAKPTPAQDQKKQPTEKGDTLPH